MRADEELLELAAKLEAAASWIETERPKAALQSLTNAATEVGRSFSGSWLGYHARVYYAEFRPPPQGARFSQQSGLRDNYFSETVGDWREYDAKVVTDYIRSSADSPGMASVREQQPKTAAYLRSAKSDIGSILTGEAVRGDDKFLEKLLADLETIDGYSSTQLLQVWQPRGQFLSSDIEALGQGLQVPPHFSILAETGSLNSSFLACRQLAELARKAGSHLARRASRNVAASRVGTNVFIGHGRSGAWRELKDFVKDRLGLPFDEFNRVPVAGVTNIARLNEMLDAAAVAFVIMTAEDEQKDGKLQARMNVIHEVGLFQGRLGFTKGIVMLEEGCEEFSNIQGLGQIRFPAGRISAAFEEVRQVLEREGVLSTD
ncbi:TIR domain-containing protein [Bosea sp. (in: a-proteobacteria)]|jgi:predicted nucleotide-binding protein|uniref:TIR domain-containing protein n=1 Tax=Bosea sp. (in: a-proteobacteria) TaxID=1871050 RepID=UPI002DDCA48F|nr:TIR domain-containing protein [Bosea sp. (in: a-proteobacteria)]HEV2512582.1 TIR domain-containing protein [Bosea sp. (in: a-proteobacteria)]